MQIFLFCNHSLLSVGGEYSELQGSISVEIPAGSPDSPFFWVASSSLKGNAVFRGQVKETNDNNVSFYEVPNLLDPDEMQPPFKAGMLASHRARGRLTLEANGTIAEAILEFNGSNYRTPPEVYVELPTSGTSAASDFRKAEISAAVDSSAQIVSSLEISDAGLGYTHVPRIRFEGGAHFIRLVEHSSQHAGKFFKILANDGASILLENKLGSDLSEVFKPDQSVEIYEAWTLGSLLGHSSEEVMLAEGNESTADYVYLLKPNEEQNGSSSDFTSYYHDGNLWRSLDDPDKNDSADTVVIRPDQAFIIARRNPTPLELIFSGSATTNNTFGHFPAHLQRRLLSNPYGVDVMLSDLISTTSITMDPDETDKWLAHESQEVADNVKVLSNNVWTTYWNDGANRLVTQVARATARYGTGIGGGLTQQDISMSSGVISAMTNPSTAPVVVTSENHGLKNRFTIVIQGAKGYKTNESKEQVDENGNLVSLGAIPLIIPSGANGIFEISVLDEDHFEIVGKSGNCDFIDNQEATWSTGTGGSGYTSNAYVSFVGGGGNGAKGIANVDPVAQKVVSIMITEAGAGYLSAPKVFVHSGGWKKLGAGNAPFNDVLIPAGSGILLVRNHERGERSLFGISSPF